VHVLGMCRLSIISPRRAVEGGQIAEPIELPQAQFSQRRLGAIDIGTRARSVRCDPD